MTKIRLWLDHQLPGVGLVEEIMEYDTSEWAEMTTEQQVEVTNRRLAELVADHVSCGWDEIEQ